MPVAGCATSTTGWPDARAYATAALTAFQAAVSGTNPLTGLSEPGNDDTWDEPPLHPPADSRPSPSMAVSRTPKNIPKARTRVPLHT